MFVFFLLLLYNLQNLFQLLESLPICSIFVFTIILCVANFNPNGVASTIETTNKPPILRNYICRFPNKYVNMRKGEGKGSLERLLAPQYNIFLFPFCEVFFFSPRTRPSPHFLLRIVGRLGSIWSFLALTPSAFMSVFGSSCFGLKH